MIGTGHTCRRKTKYHSFNAGSKDEAVSQTTKISDKRVMFIYVLLCSMTYRNDYHISTSYAKLLPIRFSVCTCKTFVVMDMVILTLKDNQSSNQSNILSIKHSINQTFNQSNILSIKHSINLYCSLLTFSLLQYNCFLSLSNHGNYAYFKS